MREALSGSNRYPRAEYDSLVNQIAAIHQVRAEQVVLGCGSYEILCVGAAAFLGPGKRVVQASPTYPVLGEFAQSMGANVINVPLNKTYEHDLDAMLARSDSSTGLVYICNPNNPTGTLTGRKDIEIFVRKLPERTAILIDEAYHHYVTGSSDYPSFLYHPFTLNPPLVPPPFSTIHR